MINFICSWLSLVGIISVCLGDFDESISSVSWASGKGIKACLVSV